MLNRISSAMERAARAWCKFKHHDPMWPVSGYYRCPDCLRQYPVAWEVQPMPAQIADIKQFRPVVNGLRPELVQSANA
jgi:hypothetical protein